MVSGNNILGVYLPRPRAAVRGVSTHSPLTTHHSPLTYSGKLRIDATSRAGATGTVADQAGRWLVDLLQAHLHAGGMTRQALLLGQEANVAGHVLQAGAGESQHTGAAQEIIGR